LTIWSQKLTARSQAAGSSYTTTTDQAAFASNRAPFSSVLVMVAAGKTYVAEYLDHRQPFPNRK
jgi:hypothetical protein